MENSSKEVSPKPRRGVRRWIVLALILFGAYLQFGPLPPITPNVFLPGEALPINLPILNLPLTNTFVATLIADVVVLAMGFYVWRKIKKGAMVPSGFYNLIESIFEFLWTTTVTTAGSRKNARKFFGIVATIFFLVLISSWMGIVPGIDSIGVLEPAHGETVGYAPRSLGGSVYWIDGNAEVPNDVAGAEEGEHELCVSCTITPYVRAAPTDLNFTLALALISVFMTQVFGFAAQKFGYLTKFLNFKALVTVPVMGAMDFAVGFLELISEFVKVISFTFRLFGNIFAGQLLLFILGTLLSFILPTGLYLFEIFVGLIQAYVFYLLTVIFMSQATMVHGSES